MKLEKLNKTFKAYRKFIITYKYLMLKFKQYFIH